MHLEENAVSNLYKGDITPLEAWEILQQNPNALLVDVRTIPEWQFVGLPDLASLPNKMAVLSYRLYPSMEINPNFVKELAEVATDKNVPLLFICRSGGRSQDAAIAMSEAGYTDCYNIAGGFEGELDQHKHRGNLTSWKSSQLPWEQR